MVFNIKRSILIFGVLCCFLCGSTIVSMAQSELPSLGVLEFKASSISELQAQKVSRYIEMSVLKTNRFNIVTRQLIDKIAQEREVQKTNDDLLMTDQGKAIGADYIITGAVTHFQKGVERKKDRRGNSLNEVYTSTQVNYTIKILEVKTGVIVANDSYKGSLNGIDHHIRNFVRVEFPYEFKILEVLKKKGDKNSKRVLLDGGFLQGLQPGVMLEVFEVSEENIEGHIVKREVKVGDLFLRKLDTSGNFSQCSISKGRKTVLRKTASGLNLICKIPKKLRFFGMEFEYEY